MRRKNERNERRRKNCRKEWKDLHKIYTEKILAKLAK